MPLIHRPFARRFPGVCVCITATEYQGHANDWRRASAWYGRRLTLEECAYHQGFEVPEAWRARVPDGFRPAEWTRRLYRAIGNGVPVYMAEAFGVAMRRLASGEIGSEWIVET